MQRERVVSTAAGGLYSGVEAALPLCTLALSPVGEALLASAIEPYAPLLKPYRGKTVLQSQAGDAAAASASPPQPQPRVLVDVDLPEPLTEHRILLLMPQLHQHNHTELVHTYAHTLHTTHVNAISPHSGRG